MDKDNDAQRDPLKKLLWLANKEDLQRNANWVTSLTFTPDPLSHKGRISESRPGYTQPLAVISKVEKQEKELLFLNSGEAAHLFYYEIWPQVKQERIGLYLKDADQVKGLIEDPVYKAKYLNKNTPQLVQNKTQDLIKEKEDLIKDYKDLVSRNPKRQLNPQENLNHFSQSPVILDIK